MKLSDAAKKIQELIEEVGDIEIEFWCDDENGSSYYATPEFWFDGKETVVIREFYNEDKN